jgi:hypothetical protein
VAPVIDEEAAVGDASFAAEGDAGAAAVADEGDAAAALDGEVAAALASSLLFGAVAPAFAAANAVMCVRTSVRRATVASSRAADAEAFELLPDVPALPGVAAVPAVPVAPDVALSGAAALEEARSSLRILSIAATSVPQFAFALELPDAAPCADGAAASVLDEAVRLSAAMCFFNSAT